MATDIHKLIAAISPDTYCAEYDTKTSEPIRKKVKALAKEGKYIEAAEIAKLVESSYMDIWNIRHTKSAFALQGSKNPVEKHVLVYDAFAQNLEPIYFWIIDYINLQYGETKKLVDNFMASAGSGHFADLQARATRMQEEAMKMFGQANTVLRSILNVIYDLKEFKLRLAHYKEYHSSDSQTKQSALLSLKQIWIDQVDIKRGNSAIKALAVSGANQPNFVTLLDAFMVSDSLDDVDNLDLNERVKRILKQRVSEFIRWLEQSEQELTKRFNIEKKYLQSQVNSLKLYARWIKPYLKAAHQLEQRTEETSYLVNAFNTAIFELTVIGKNEYSKEGDIASGDLPQSWRKLKARDYSSIIVMEFQFRSSPDRVDQRGGYSYRGRAEISFTSYALNEEELSVLKKEIEDDDIGDIYKIIEGATTESLGDLQKDIDEFLDDKSSEKEEEKPKSEDSNPFFALFSFLFPEKKAPPKKSKGIKPDSDAEKVLRNQAILEARWKCRKAYDDYKSANDMPKFPPIIESFEQFNPLSS